jgi:biopolymer transport protein ExbD
MDVLKKVEAWASDKKGSSRFVAGDTNVTYEDILKVCSMVKPSSPKDTSVDKGKKDVNKGSDNK